MNIIIVEDEAISARRTERLLRKFFTDDIKLNIRHEDTIEDALAILKKERFNILFLDLNLNGKSGFEIIKSVTAYSFHTIIISAYPDRATEAFEYGVLDFIVKPLTEKRLAIALNRYYNNTTRENKTEFLTFIKRGNLEIVKVEDVKYIKAIKHYSEVYLNDNSYLFHDKSLAKLENILPANFSRIHKSYIVNLNYVTKIKSLSGSKYILTLSEGTVLPIGRTKINEIRSQLQIL